MYVNEQLEKLKNLQSKVLNFIDNDENTEENCDNLRMFIIDHKIHEDCQQFKLLLHLLAYISTNHHRSPFFFDKFEHILTKFKTEIKSYYSNLEIFDIFCKNKRLILFFIKEKIISLDDIILREILDQYEQKKYPEYFSPEIKLFIKKRNLKSDISTKILNDIPKNFEEKRLKGENDEFICELIRNDSIEDFIIFVNKNECSLNYSIKPSIFETNPLFMKGDVNIIEYAAFFGSVQIFKYLLLNKANITPSIWRFAVHSDNPEMINILEESLIKKNNRQNKYYESFPYKECIIQSIKFHNNDVARYFENNYEKEKTKKTNNYKIIYGLDEYIITYCIHYFNFLYLPDKLTNYDIFFYACRYDYLPLVKLLLSTEKINIVNHAAEKNNYQIVNLLLQKVNPNVIKSNWFDSCIKLTQISLPLSVKIIDVGAFEDCSKLTHVTIPSSVEWIKKKAFHDCHSLAKVTFQNPSSLKKIGECSFSNCVSLSQISIPSSVNLIERKAFFNCTLLSDITFDEQSSLLVIHTLSFGQCISLKTITFPNSLKKIYCQAFYKCTSLIEVSIPSSVQIIDYGVFYICKSLKEISIPSPIKIINNSLFYRCISLTQIIIPPSVTQILDSAFYLCTSLIIVIIPSSVKLIGSYAFFQCTSLTKISIPSSVVSIGENAFERCKSLAKISFDINSKLTVIDKEVFKNCLSLKKIEIQSSVIKIDDKAFENCSSLQNIIFVNPSSVTSIGKNSFCGCSSLIQVDIPSSVTSIDEFAFKDCSSLQKITIPSSLKFFGKQQFSSNPIIIKTENHAINK